MKIEFPLELGKYLAVLWQMLGVLCRLLMAVKTDGFSFGENGVGRAGRS